MTATRATLSDVLTVIRDPRDADTPERPMMLGDSRPSFCATSTCLHVEYLCEPRWCQLNDPGIIEWLDEVMEWIKT